MLLIRRRRTVLFGGAVCVRTLENVLLRVKVEVELPAIAGTPVVFALFFSSNIFHDAGGSFH